MELLQPLIYSCLIVFVEPLSSVLTSQVCSRLSLCARSLCEYFKLLLPLVRDGGDWAAIVRMQRGCCGMRLPGVWCVMTGVWLLTPAGRLHVCLFCYTWPAVTSPDPHIQIVTHARTHAYTCITAAELQPRSHRRGPSGSEQEDEVGLLDTFDTCSGKMFPNCNTEVCLSSMFVQDLSNADDVFVVGHLFPNFTAALWF